MGGKAAGVSSTRILCEALIRPACKPQSPHNSIVYINLPGSILQALQACKDQGTLGHTASIVAHPSAQSTSGFAPFVY